MAMNELKIQNLIISWALKNRDVCAGMTLGMVHELSAEIIEHGEETPQTMQELHSFRSASSISEEMKAWLDN